MADLIGAPVEIAVLGFPGRRFDGHVIPAIAELVDDRILTILDLVLISKHADGTVTSFETNELSREEAAEFDILDGEIIGLLNAEDIDRVGAALSVGSSAILVVWEDTWAGRLIDAVADAGGQVLALDRVDVDCVKAVMSELAAQR